jgi:hypothetical protein
LSQVPLLQSPVQCDPQLQLANRWAASERFAAMTMMIIITITMTVPPPPQLRAFCGLSLHRLHNLRGSKRMIASPARH